MDGWNTSILVSFWGKRPIFRCELLVSGSVYVPWRCEFVLFFGVFSLTKTKSEPEWKTRVIKGFQVHYIYTLCTGSEPSIFQNGGSELEWWYTLTIKMMVCRPSYKMYWLTSRVCRYIYIYTTAVKLLSVLRIEFLPLKVLRQMMMNRPVTFFGFRLRIKRRDLWFWMLENFFSRMTFGWGCGW